MYGSLKISFRITNDFNEYDDVINYILQHVIVFDLYMTAYETYLAINFGYMTFINDRTA